MAFHGYILRLNRCWLGREYQNVAPSAIYTVANNVSETLVNMNGMSMKVNKKKPNGSRKKWILFLFVHFVPPFFIRSELIFFITLYMCYASLFLPLLAAVL